MKKYLIVIAGPTAAGKTRLAIDLAKHYSSEILSTDSRQFYKEMNIGTAKPSKKELKAAIHHMIGFLSVRQEFNVKEFEEKALEKLHSIFARHPVAIATGGSGLYIKTLCEGIDEMPPIPYEVREKWQKKWEEQGLETLVRLLEKTDPEYYKQADIRNPRRVIRALEVYDTTGTPYTEFRNMQQKSNTTTRNFHTVKIGITRNREELYKRINQRVDQMLAEGLIEEARSLYPYRNLNALQTVGYQELFPYFDNQYDLEEAIRLIKRNSRRYAKRQMTWFRKDESIQWFNLSESYEDQVLAQIISYIDSTIKT